MTPEVAVGWSALTAATATVVGAVTLIAFFSRGQPWGTINDASTVVLMLALVPVALFVAVLESETVTTVAVAVAALGIVAMLITAALQVVLVAGRVTYEQTKAAVLAGSAVVGVWYVLVGLLAEDTALAGVPAWTAIAAGIGFILVGVGFALGNERHPLAAGGGALALLGSSAFLLVLGGRLLGGDLVAPAWNA
jgi:hypothetical protein